MVIHVILQEFATVGKELKKARAYSQRGCISRCLCTTISRCNVYITMYACGDGNQIRVSLQPTLTKYFPLSLQLSTGHTLMLNFILT